MINQVQIMSGRIMKSTSQAIKYFSNPLIQGKNAVIPPPKIPSHIIMPQYVTQKKPLFGIYQGPSTVHGPQAIKKLRASASIASQVLSSTQSLILSSWVNQSALTQQQIDLHVFNQIISHEAYPTPIGFMNFPKSVCVSVNQCIVHGIPSIRQLEEGDKINIDVTVYKDGYHGDTNLTVFYGQPKYQPVRRIAQLAQQALYKAIAICKPGTPFNQIGKLLENFAKQHKITVCDDFSGHGVGHLLHMPPMVLHKYDSRLTDIMQVGNVFTIQPIFLWHPITRMNMWKDKFTIICPDNPNAQFEHTILIVDDGCEVLTVRKNETIPNPNDNIKNLL